MTRQARMVLADCRVALEELEDGVTGARWRVRWTATVTLLRAVGHVLAKVDGADPAWRPIIEAAWARVVATKPEPVILWEFIEAERNSVLKQYRPKAGQGVTVHVGSDTLVEYAYGMNEGPYKDRDSRDVAREAIDWWDGYLQDIEAEHERLYP